MKGKEAMNLGLAALLGVILVASGCAAPGPAVPGPMVKQAQPVNPGPPPSLNIYYIGMTGKVGHHLVASAKGKCPVMWNAENFEHVSGNLPPGLSFRASAIEGIPEIPGKWQVTVRFTGIECQGQRYADQNVNVYFDIEGMAPRKVR